MLFTHDLASEAVDAMLRTLPKGSPYAEGLTAALDIIAQSKWANNRRSQAEGIANELRDRLIELITADKEDRGSVARAAIASIVEFDRQQAAAELDD